MEKETREQYQQRMSQEVSKNISTNEHEHMSVKDWLITMLITMIPFVGIIMVFVWAFKKDVNPSKSSYMKALLLFLAIIILIFVTIIFAFGGLALLATTQMPLQ